MCATSQERGQDEGILGDVATVAVGPTRNKTALWEVDDRGRQRPDTREEDQEQTIYPRTPIVPPPSLSPQV